MWSRPCGLALLFLPLPLAAATREQGKPLRQLAEQLTLIQEELSKEGDQDKDAADKLGCWCKTNLQEEQGRVDSMQQQLTGLSSDIDAESASTSRLKLELKSHEEELDSNQQSLATAEALRQKQAGTFADDEQTHSQNIQQLDAAMTVLDGGRASALQSHAESPSRSMAALFSDETDASLISLGKKLRPTSRVTQQHVVLAQLVESTGAGRLRRRQSPDVVKGVLHEMRSTFARDLDDIRKDETTAADRHEGLVKAKSEQIVALKKAVLSKKRRAADGAVKVSQNQEVSERTSKLMQATSALVSSIKSLCDSNTEALETRQSERQAEIVALTSAQAALSGSSAEAAANVVTGIDEQSTIYNAFAGAQLSAEGRARIIPQAEELCLTTIAVSDEKFRSQAKAACEQARAGDFQSAADGAEALQEGLEEEQKSVASQREQCQRQQEDAKSALEGAEKSASAEEAVIDSDKQTVDDQINSITEHGSSLQKAKDDVVAAMHAEAAVFQSIRETAYKVQNLLKYNNVAAGSSAGGHITEAVQHAEKLSTMAAAFAKDSNQKVQEVQHNIDVTSSVAARALTPLRTIHADTEEKAISTKEDRSEREHAPMPNCNVNALSAKEASLGEHARKLGEASANLAYAGLR